MATITFDKTTCIYPGSAAPVADALDSEIKDGESLILMGPLDCGESTLLWVLVGSEEVNSGRILIGDKDVTDTQPKDRDIAMVLQGHALYLHITVRNNMDFIFKIVGTPKDEVNRRVEEATKTLDLTQYPDCKPKALFGGQRQHAVMGRAIARKPQIFLVDEPLSNLSAKLRIQTRTQVALLQRSLGITTLYMTHDQTEALTIGGRIAVLKDNIPQQAGTPDEICQVLANEFVAGFIDSPSMNPHKFRVGGEIIKFSRAMLTVSLAQCFAVVDADNGEVTIGFRPRDLSITAEEGPGVMPVIVDITEELGSNVYIYGHFQDDEVGTSGSVIDDHLVV